MIMVKDASGSEQAVASNGKANAGLTLGIIGTALGGLWALGGGNGGSGLFNGLGGGTNNCYVTESMFYNSEIANIREMYSNLMNTNSRICDLEQRVSVDETSIAKNFEIENMRSNYEQQLMKCYVDSKCCDFVKAQHYLSPSQLADPYMGGRQIIATYNQTPYCEGYYNTGCGCGC